METKTTETKIDNEDLEKKEGQPATNNVEDGKANEGQNVSKDGKQDGDTQPAPNQNPGANPENPEGEEKETQPTEEEIRNKILSEIGIDESQMSLIKNIMSAISGNKDEKKEANTDEKVIELQRRTEMAELKANLMQQGVLPNYVDDAVTLMMTKKVDKKDFDIKTAMAEFKSKYPEWFTSEEGKKQKGTGSSVKASKGSSNSDGKNGLGARLAALKKPNGKKSSYWS